MAATDLGSKHVCFKCGTKFYDLKKPEALCPKCGADQKLSPAKGLFPSCLFSEKLPTKRKRACTT